jgi:hypothetical protein
MHGKKARWSFVASAAAATLLLSGAADALEVGKKATRRRC